MQDVERRAIGKVMRRLIPFLILCYFVAYLDRVNVSFAKLQMNSGAWLQRGGVRTRRRAFLHRLFPV